MKIDSKEKLERVRNFMLELKIKPSMEPFLALEDIGKNGIYDFHYINPATPTIHLIDKKIKDSRYEFFGQLVADLNAMAQAVEDYLLTDDPYQAHCARFREQVSSFSKRFQEDFKHTLIAKAPEPQLTGKASKGHGAQQASQAQQKKQPASSLLSDGLEALFLLRGNQNNEAYLRSIGRMYGMGYEQGEDYVLTLDPKNQHWRQLLSRQSG